MVSQRRGRSAVCDIPRAIAPYLLPRCTTVCSTEAMRRIAFRPLDLSMITMAGMLRQVGEKVNSSQEYFASSVISLQHLSPNIVSAIHRVQSRPCFVDPSLQPNLHYGTSLDIPTAISPSYSQQEVHPTLNLPRRDKDIRAASPTLSSPGTLRQIP